MFLIDFFCQTTSYISGKKGGKMLLKSLNSISMFVTARLSERCQIFGQDLH